MTRARFMLVAVTVFSMLAAHSCRLPSWIVEESNEIVHSAESAIDRSAETMQGFKKLPALTQESPLSWPGIRTPIRASEPPTAPLPELQKSIDMQIVDQLSLEEAGRLIAVQTGITITVADGHPRNHTRRHILARCCSWRARLPGDSTWFPMESSGRTGADLLHGSPVMDHLRACRFRTVAGDSRTFRSGEWRRRRFGSAGERPGCRHHGHCRFLATAGDDHRRIAVTRRPLDAQPSDRRT